MPNTNLTEVFTGIANSIREKNGTTDTYKPTEMAAAISAIQTGGGSSEVTVRTPDEIYAQDRPADWPVLPDPTEDRETYFLCETIWNGTIKTFVLPQGPDTKDVEWGYTDENGEFVVTHSMTNQKGVYWGTFGVGDDGHPETNKYYVMRVTGDATYDAPTRSGQTSKTPYVLEIKARISNPKFGTGRTGYFIGFTNCHFITLYGPQNWSADSSKKFREFKKLKCLRFDSDENNIFLHPNSTVTNLSYLFGSCDCLEYAYPINNFTQLTDIHYIYSTCRNLKKVALENDTVTDMAYALELCKGIKECSIKLPKGTDPSGLFASGTINKFTNLDLSGIQTLSDIKNILGSCGEEILNVKINSSLNYDSSWPGYCSNGSQKLQRFTMAPDQNGMPTRFKIMLYTADKNGIKECFESLPTITTSCSLTIYNYALSSLPDEELLSIATNKGYTVSFVSK